MRAYARTLHLRLCYKSSFVWSRSTTTCTRCKSHLSTCTSRPRIPPTCKALIISQQHQQQRRTLFSFFNASGDKAAHQAAQQNPGIPVVATLCRFKHEDIGFEPNTEELVTAFRHMSAGEKFANTLAYPNNVFGLTQVFDTLITRNDDHLLPRESVSKVLRRIPKFLPRKDSNEPIKQVDLGLANYCMNWLLDPSKNSEGLTALEIDSFIKIVCNYDEVVEARKAFISLYRNFGPELVNAKTWTHVLKSYARQKDEQSMFEAWDEIEKLGLKRDKSNYLVIFQYYLETHNHTGVRQWYDKMVSEGMAVYSVYRMIFYYYSRPGTSSEAYTWSNDIFASFLSDIRGEGKPALKIPSTDGKDPIWTLVLRWCLAQGKGVDDIDKLMYSASTTDGIDFRPSIDILNGLIEYAVQLKDAYLAQRLFNLAEKWQLKPNRITYGFIVEYRLLANDIEGAKVAWEEMKYHDWNPESDSKHVATQLLLQAFCQTPIPDVGKIEYVLQDLHDHSISLSIESLSALSKVYLERSDFEKYVETLLRDILHATPQDRRTIMNVGIEHMRKDTTTLDSAWEIYNILRNIFTEINAEQHAVFMDLFFKRERVDLGVMIFSNMRHSSSARPTGDMYIRCIKEIEARCWTEGLSRVHGFLKLDTDVDPDTSIYNALMYAYTMCQQPRMALDIYRLIIRSSEGPNRDTLNAAMLACGATTSGLEHHGKAIWSRFVKEYKIIPDATNWAYYIKAMILNGDHDGGWEMARTLQSAKGIRPNWHVLWALYHYLPSTQADAVEEWGINTYPQEWQELVDYPDGRFAERKRLHSVKYEGNMDDMIAQFPGAPGDGM